MPSQFLKIEGNTVKNRIWSFLIVHSEYDYSMRDIAKYAKVSYTALKQIWKEFVQRKIVVHTRNVGKAKMFRLNRNNPQVETFIDYYWAVIESGIKKQLPIDEKPRYHETGHSIDSLSAYARSF